MITPQLTIRPKETPSKSTEGKSEKVDLTKLFGESPETVRSCFDTFKTEFEHKHTNKIELLRLLAFGKRIDNSNTNIGGTLTPQMVTFLRTSMADLEKRINANDVPKPRLRLSNPPKK